MIVKFPLCLFSGKGKFQGLEGETRFVNLGFRSELNRECLVIVVLEVLRWIKFVWSLEDVLVVLDSDVLEVYCVKCLWQFSDELERSDPNSELPVRFRKL